MVAGFEGIWKAKGEAALAGYVREHATCLRQVLLFEVAHEGRATAAMTGAARLGGLSADLAAREHSLQGLLDPGGA